MSISAHNAAVAAAAHATNIGPSKRTTDEITKTRQRQTSEKRVSPDADDDVNGDDDDDDDDDDGLESLPT